MMADEMWGVEKKISLMALEMKVVDGFRKKKKKSIWM